MEDYIPATDNNGKYIKDPLTELLMHTGSYQWPDMWTRLEQSKSAKAAIKLLETLKEYEIVVEKAEGNYSAYSPDLPGCVATGDTEEEVYLNMMDAIRFHVEELTKENPGH